MLMSCTFSEEEYNQDTKNYFTLNKVREDFYNIYLKAPYNYDAYRLTAKKVDSEGTFYATITTANLGPDRPVIYAADIIKVEELETPDLIFDAEAINNNLNTKGTAELSGIYFEEGRQANQWVELVEVSTNHLIKTKEAVV